MLGVQDFTGIRVVLVFFQKPSFCGVAVKTYREVNNFLDDFVIFKNVLGIKNFFFDKFHLDLIQNLVFEDPQRFNILRSQSI